MWRSGRKAGTREPLEDGGGRLDCWSYWAIKHLEEDPGPYHTYLSPLLARLGQWRSLDMCRDARLAYSFD